MPTTATKLKAYLDSLSQLPGSILYRDTINWKALAPGAEGQILTLDQNQMPAWRYGARFNPALMLYNNPTGWFEGQLSVSGQQQTFYARIQPEPHTASHRIFRIAHPAGFERMHAMIFPSSHPTLPNHARFFVQDLNGTMIFDARSKDPMTQIGDQLIAWSHQADTAQYDLRINGDPDAVDVLTNDTGPLGEGTAPIAWGAINGGSGQYHGKIGMTGYRQMYVNDLSALPEDPTTIFQIDTDTWTQWEGVPDYWNPWGDLSDNEAAAANLQQNGSPIFVPQ